MKAALLLALAVLALAGCGKTVRIGERSVVIDGKISDEEREVYEGAVDRAKSVKIEDAAE